MSKEQFLGIVRHVLGAAGAYLIAIGVVDEGLVAEVTGALMTLAAVVWSLLAKGGLKQPPGGALLLLLAAAALLLPGCGALGDYPFRVGVTLDEGTLSVGDGGAKAVLDLRSRK